MVEALSQSIEQQQFEQGDRAFKANSKAAFGGQNSPFNCTSSKSINRKVISTR